MEARRSRPPYAVPEILPSERADPRARVVANAILAVEVDPGAECTLAAVELGVLVVGEGFVVAARRAKRIDTKGRMMPVLHEPARVPRAVRGTTGSHW
jgi:hypothetical protein